MKRIALLVVLALALASTGGAQTIYNSPNVAEYADTATTAWQSVLVSSIPTYFVRSFYNLEVNLLSGGDLYFALTTADTGGAGTFNAIKYNQTLWGTAAPCSYWVGTTAATRLWFKSASTSIFSFKFR
jgi:hypothetical protein